MATQSTPKISEREYLELERAAEYRSEFINGEIFEMPGGSGRHSRLTIRWAIQLELQVEHRDCAVFSSDLKIITPLSGSYVYPDVSVVSGRVEFHPGTNDVLINPSVVIEVLSPSTADDCQGEKFRLYREVASLRDYVLAHTAAPRISHYTRQPDNSWLFREHIGLEASIALTSISCEIKLSELYISALQFPDSL